MKTGRDVLAVIVLVFALVLDINYFAFGVSQHNWSPSWQEAGPMLVRSSWITPIVLVVLGLIGFVVIVYSFAKKDDDDYDEM